MKLRQLQRGWMYRHRHVQMELLLVLAILVVITGLSAMTYGRVIERVRKTTDSINVRVLNDMTTSLALLEGTPKDTVFDNESSSEEHIERLVKAGLLPDVIEPLQSEHRFHWSFADGRWRLVPKESTDTAADADDPLF